MREEKRSGAEEFGGFLDYIDRLLVDNPREAHRICESIPVLVAELDVDVRARAYTCLGTASLKVGKMERARWAFGVAEEMAGDCQPQTRALIKLRRSAIAKHELRHDDAEEELREALALASLDPTGPLQGSIQIERGVVASFRGDFAAGAEFYAAAIDTLPRESYLAQIASWNLVLALYYLDGRDAQALLQQLSHLGLRCRRTSKSVQRTVPGCMLCWVEGYLLGVLGSTRQAVRNLTWAATSLYGLGEVREATLCVLDLAVIDHESLSKVAEILKAFAEDSETPKAIAQAALRWATWPGTDTPEKLRQYLLHQRQGDASDY